MVGIGDIPYDWCLLAAQEGVVRTIPPDMSVESQDLRIPGMGVEFERFGGAIDRRAIESFLHENESSTLRPENGILSV